MIKRFQQVHLWTVLSECYFENKNFAFLHSKRKCLTAHGVPQPIHLS